MFDIRRDPDGKIRFTGRLDAAHAERARETMSLAMPGCVVDLSGLEYISSAGLSVLLETQRRLVDAGRGLVLRNPSKHISDLFRVAGFDTIFEIEQ